MEARRVGERGLLVECADSTSVASTYAMLQARAGVLKAVEMVPAARTVLLDGLADPEATLALIADWTPDDAADPPSNVASQLVEIETRYDGPDLDEVARQWDTTPEEVVRIHQESVFVVTFCGFAPGFAYCSGLPEGRIVRRRAEPRSAVPLGSVALAGEYTSVYPAASPGGWQLIGTTSERMWRPELDSPALLAPGTRVRFVDRG